MQYSHTSYKNGRRRSVNIGCGTGIFAVIVYIVIFAWYANTIVPHTYPTVYTNFFWGLLHGIFAVPTFIWSLFADTITIYQVPNNGNWYNFGFMLGIGAFVTGAAKNK